MVPSLVVLALVAGVAIVAARRRRPAVPPRRAPAGNDAIDAFWSWWRSRGAQLVADAIADKRPQSIADELTSQVHRIHERLSWELGKGRNSQHHLAVSSEGDSELRVLAERWKSRAPPPDATWEFHASRQPTPNAASFQLTIADVPLDFSALRFAWDVDRDRERLHVKVHHPRFGELPDSPRVTATFVMVDNLLGEDDVERWLGSLESSVEPLPESQPADAFVAAVRALAADAKGESWQVMKAETEHGVFFATINVALKKVDHLLMDQHHEVVVTFDDPTDAGLTTKAEEAVLNAMEDDLLARVGRDAVWIGRESGGGSRSLHLHAAAYGPVPDRIAQWRAMYPQRRIEVRVRHDPSWEILRKF